MTNTLATSSSSPTYDEDTLARCGDEEALHEGAADEVPHKGGEVEDPLGGEESEVRHEGEDSDVPHEGGESECPNHPEGSADDDPAVGQLFEDHSLVVDALAGPSGEQPQVAVQQAAAVTGGDDPPELCEYEKLRERNIRERDEAMREAMEEIEESKQEMRDNAPGAKKASSSEEAGGRGRKPIQCRWRRRRSGGG